MNHAFILTAYRDPQSLKTLIGQLLTIEGARIYCNIDHRSQSLASVIRDWIKQEQIGNPAFAHVQIFDQWTIRYASTDHLAAQLRLIQLALNNGADYCHTLTGQCRLICKPGQFITFFNEHAGQSFIEHFSLPASHWSGDGGLDRIQYFQLYDVLDIKKWGAIFDISNRFIRSCQKLLKLDRRKSYPFEPHQFWGGLGYWSLYKDALHAILEHPLITSNIYKHSHCAEEFISHTLLLNSPYSKANPTKIISNHLRYMDWEICHGESPGILDISHLENIQAGNNNEYPYLFARKFDSRFSQELEDKLLTS